MSDKNHHPAGGDPSKTRASALPRLAATRHNDTFCLVYSIRSQADCKVIEVANCLKNAA